ncbi:MAG: dihydrolipoyl dehydrogenase [Pelagibacterales bacterium MED-G40]|nr:MAG: dihydrolipoyl dehydrogenase [Pelagibacterales bacterium MED-G40]|tara:strand:- start:19066 stop:20469 length:1404 start_codon:yes stop_codon:yes gene_type:complete
MENSFDVIVIGGGPGGYVCAIRAAQLGLKTACIESRGALGGTCLNVGCIPSKSLLNLSDNYKKAKQEFNDQGIEISDIKLNIDKMMVNKNKSIQVLTKGVEFLFKKNKVTYLKGKGVIFSKNDVMVYENGKKNSYKGKNIIIATGSSPASLPGVEIDEKNIISSTGALSLSKVPKTLVIVGGGYIGLEMGSVWSRLGSKVTVVEFLDHIIPGMDREISNEFQKILKKQGINFKLNCKVTGVSSNSNKATIELIDNKTSEKTKLDCDKVLVSVGRKPYTEGLNLNKIGIKKDEKGRIEINDKFQTSIKNIYAIGDVIKGPMLAHKAEEEGIAVAEILAGQAGHVNYNVIPGVIYTSPEVAAVGKTEEELKKEKIHYKIGKFPFLANSRAKVNNETDGFVKILADARTDKVLGVHIIGPHSGDMIAEMALGMEFGASAEDIARTCHAHPTHTEAIKEAALSVDKRPIHF